MSISVIDAFFNMQLEAIFCHRPDYDRLRSGAQLPGKMAPPPKLPRLPQNGDRKDYLVLSINLKTKQNFSHVKVKSTITCVTVTLFLLIKLRLIFEVHQGSNCHCKQGPHLMSDHNGSLKKVASFVAYRQYFYPRHRISERMPIEQQFHCNMTAAAVNT